MKAIVFVDVQKDFIDGALKNEKAIEVTPKIVEFAEECVKNGYKLYATRDTHEKTKFNYHFEGEKRVDEPVDGYLSTLEGKNLPVEHCIEGTDGWMIGERLWNEIEGKCTVVNKNTFGSLDLAEVMQEDLNAWDDKNYFDEIIICGFCTDICVISNAMILKARFPNAKITVMKDLCAGTTEENHENALKAMKSCQIDIE